MIGSVRLFAKSLALCKTLGIGLRIYEPQSVLFPGFKRLAFLLTAHFSDILELYSNIYENVLSAHPKLLS